MDGGLVVSLICNGIMILLVFLVTLGTSSDRKDLKEKLRSEEYKSANLSRRLKSYQDEVTFLIDRKIRAVKVLNGEDDK